MLYEPSSSSCFLIYCCLLLFCFCIAPDDFVILAYVKHLLPLIQLTTSKVESYSGSSSSSSSSSRQIKRDLAVCETESPTTFASDYATRIAGIVDDIDNKEKLLVLLRNAKQAISPYDYDCKIFSFSSSVLVFVLIFFFLLFVSFFVSLVRSAVCLLAGREVREE